MAQAKLLDTAIREFGLKGLDGASTRGIAAAAGTAMSAITYHFGGKEGLYLAAADHIAAHMADELGPALNVDSAVGDDDVAGARAAIHRILARFTDKMAGDASADWALFIVREQMNPTEAFDRLYGGLMGEMMRTLVRLVCAATQVRAERDAQITALTLMGQVVALRASRGTWLRLLGHDTITDADRIAIRRRIAANTDAILDRVIADAKGQA